MEKGYILMHGRINLNTKIGKDTQGWSYHLLKTRAEHENGWDEGEDYCTLFQHDDTGKYRIVRGSCIKTDAIGSMVEAYHNQSRRFMGYLKTVDIKKVKDMHEWKDLVGGYTLPCGTYK